MVFQLLPGLRIVKATKLAMGNRQLKFVVTVLDQLFSPLA